MDGVGTAMTEPVLTQRNRETLTFVTEEVDTLKLIKAAGVCRDQRSKARANHGNPEA